MQLSPLCRGAGLSATPGIRFANVFFFFSLLLALMQVVVVLCEWFYTVLAFSVLLCCQRVTQLPSIALSLSRSRSLCVCEVLMESLLSPVLDKHQTPPITALFPPQTPACAHPLCYFLTSSASIMHPHTPSPHSILLLTHPFC